VVAVVAVVALVAGGSFAAIQLAGGDDDSAGPAEPTPTDDPAPTVDPTDPSPNQVAAGSWDAVPSDAEVNQVATSLEDAGYACYDTVGAMLTADEPVVVDGQPVLVRSCYLDPASGRDQEQTVSLQAAPDGSVNGVRVTVNAFLDKDDQRTSRWFADALRGLTGSVLQAPEARALVAGQTPDIAWGTAALDINPAGTSYQLDLVAEGSDITTVPAASTQLSIQEVRTHYSGEGFNCRDGHRSVVCERSGRGYSLLAIAVDPCYGPGAPADCPDGHTVRSLTLNAEFDSGMPERAYTPIFDHLVTEGLPFAYGDAWSSEVDTAFAALDVQKPHRVDIEGLHVEFLPGATVSFAPDFEQSYQVEVEGICASDC